MTGIELKQYREEVLKMTQQQLADKLEMARPYLSNLEQTDTPIRKVLEMAVKSLPHPQPPRT